METERQVLSETALWGGRYRKEEVVDECLLLPRTHYSHWLEGLPIKRGRALLQLSTEGVSIVGGIVLLSHESAGDWAHKQVNPPPPNPSPNIWWAVIPQVMVTTTRTASSQEEPEGKGKVRLAADIGQCRDQVRGPSSL